MQIYKFICLFIVCSSFDAKNKRAAHLVYYSLCCKRTSERRAAAELAMTITEHYYYKE